MRRRAFNCAILLSEKVNLFVLVVVGDTTMLNTRPRWLHRVFRVKKST